MSRVLRRPMFRGGIADSEGVGITSGLMEPRQGYANGPTIEGVQPSFTQRIYDMFNPSTQTIVERLQANQQQSPVVEEGSVLQSIYDAINPSKETIVKRLQERQLAQGEPIIKTQSYREEQKRIAKIMEDKERVEKLKLEENEKLKTAVKGTDTETGVRAGGTEQPAKSDLKTVYEDLLPLFSKELGASEDEFSRQKYLELAKFGLNLLRQPGGPPGGERNLLGAIAASAEKPLEGYQTILAKEKQAQRLPKALALEAAMKEVEPGNIMRQVRDIQRLNPNLSASEALNKILSTGQATVGETTERRIKTNAEALKSEIGESAGLKLSRTIERSGVDYSQITKIPKDKKGNIEKEKITEGYYYDEEGKLYKVGKDKNIQTVVVK